MNALTQQGIQAIKAGDKAQARQLLRAALQQDSQDVQAWLWLSAAVDTDQEKIDCLQQVLRLDPNNQAAAKGIAQLIAKGAASLQLNQPQPVQVAQPQLAVAAAPPMAVGSIPGPHGSVKQQNPDQILFKVKPSLIPTMVGGGIALVIIAVLLLVIFGPLMAAMFGYGEDSAGGIVICGSALLLVLLLFPLLRRIVVLLFTTYTLTQRHLIIDSGILAKQHKTIPVQRIQDVAYHQSLLERIFGIGDVIVESAGEWGSIHLKFMADCKLRTQEILALISRDGR